MEFYQWSNAWWLFRIITGVEIGAIIYLFYMTWQLRECLSRLMDQIKIMDHLDVRLNKLHDTLTEKEIIE